MAVVGADHDGDARTASPRREGHFRKRTANGFERRFPGAVPAREAEVPILNIVTTPIPFIRPGKHEGPGTPFRKGGPDQPVQSLCLLVFPIAPAVETHLRKNERTLARKVLEPRQITFPA